MKEDGWEEVLEKMYSDEEPRLTEGEISERAGLTESETKKTMKFLIEAGLVEKKLKGSTEYVLTAKGFDVAHERMMRRERIEHDREIGEQQDRTNRAIALLTVGLVLVTSLDSLVRALVGRQQDEWAVGIAIVSIIVAVILVRVVSEAKITRRE